MSIVLDALRRGRSRRIPEPVHAARTDAVLQTLGQRRKTERASVARVVDALGAVLLAVAAGIFAALLVVNRRT